MLGIYFQVSQELVRLRRPVAVLHGKDVHSLLGPVPMVRFILAQTLQALSVDPARRFGKSLVGEQTIWGPICAYYDS